MKSKASGQHDTGGVSVTITNRVLIVNTTAADDDGDGVRDGRDAFPVDPTETNDHDQDGIGDNTDDDDDNDGKSDEEELLVAVISLQSPVLITAY